MTCTSSASTPPSPRWTADNSSTRDGGEPPTIRVKLGALDAALNVALDLGTNFTVSHISASTVSLTIASDKDGTIYDGSWDVTGFASTAPFAFASLGVRTITVTASYGITSVQASFTVDVLDTPPDVTILAPNLSPWQNVPQTYTAQATDQNEPGGILPCTAITWSVDAPNVLSATTGCTVSITFASLGPGRSTSRASPCGGSSRAGPSGRCVRTTGWRRPSAGVDRRTWAEARAHLERTGRDRALVRATSTRSAARW